MHSTRVIRIVSVVLAVWLCAAPLTASAAKNAKIVPKVYYITDEETAPVLSGDCVSAAWETSGSVHAAASNLPDKWDARTKGYVTAVRNQGAANCCWSFAGLGAIEVNYVKEGYGTASSTDFSESHLTWFGQRQRTTDTSDPTYGDGLMYNNPYLAGGSWEDTASALMRGSGIVREQDAPWYFINPQKLPSDFANILMRNMTLQEKMRYNSDVKLWSAEGVQDLSRERTKQLIMENGAVVMSYHHDYDKYNNVDVYFNKTNSCYYRNAYAKNNHAVTVIGWDDSFPKTNFNSTSRPKNDGAWLVKGSWGTTYGNGGFYWISYDEPSIKNIASFKTAPATLYDRLYQYDGTFPMAFTQNSEAGIGNVFTAADNEMLTHVAYFNNNSGPIDVAVEVYVQNENAHNFTPEDPTVGMHRVDEASTTDHDVRYGYFTTTLTQPVPLNKGDRFFVAVRFIDPKGAVLDIPMEGITVQNPQEGIRTWSSPRRSDGDSFVFYGGEWYNTHTDFGGFDYNNVPVKAMTQRRSVSVEPTLTVLTPPRKTEYKVGEAVDTTGLSLLYIDQYGTQNTLTEGFVCAQGVFSSAGMQTVQVSYGDLSCSFDVTVANMPGDANGDGQITLVDAALISRYIAGGWNLAIDISAADVNGDGQVTLIDSVLISRYIAGGWGVEFL